MEDDPNSLAVDLSVTVTPTNPPAFIGKTNLPDGTQVAVNLMGVLVTNGQPACYPKCGFQQYVNVKNGRFETDWNLTQGQKLNPWSYRLLLMVLPDAAGQPPNVTSLLGKKGEHLRGPYVTAQVDHKFVPATFPWNPDSSSDDGAAGLWIQYNQRIIVTTDGARATNRPSAVDIDFETPISQKNSAGEETGRQQIAAPRAATPAAIPKTDAYKPNWQSIEADNGAVYKLDMNSIKPGIGGAAQITVYADEGNQFDSTLNLKFLLFDCKGRFIEMNRSMSQSAYAPPKSIVGQIGAIACARAQAATAEIDAESVRRGLSPEEYCKGFSPEACNRMKSTIDSNEKPPFCKTGFALVGSGLTAEQLRICYVMTSPAFTRLHQAN